MKNFKNVLKAVINEGKNFSTQEIEGMKKNAVSVQKVYVVVNNGQAAQMFPKKNKDTTHEVIGYKLTTDKLKPLNLNHVNNAIENKGTFVRSISGNPVMLVTVNKN